MKLLIGLLSLLAMSLSAQVPYVSAPTNTPADMQIIQRTGNRNRWVPIPSGGGDATNVFVIAGTNIIVITNAQFTWTVSSITATNVVNTLATNVFQNNITNVVNVLATNVALQNDAYWATNASEANSISNKYFGPVWVFGGPLHASADIPTDNAIEINQGLLANAAWGRSTLLYADNNPSVQTFPNGIGFLTNSVTSFNDGKLGWAPFNVIVTNSNAGITNIIKNIINSNGIAVTATGSLGTTTNGNLVTVTNGFGVKAGSNITTSTNGNEVTVNGQAGGISFTDATNASLTTISNQMPNFIHGTTNQIARFTPNTNEVGDSILDQSGTHTIDLIAGVTNSSVNFNLYGLYTNATHYDRVSLFWDGTAYNLQASRQNMAGTAPVLTFGVNGAQNWFINSNGDFDPEGDNTVSIGANSHSVNNIWMAGTLVVPVGSTSVKTIGIPSGVGMFLGSGDFDFCNSSSQVVLRMDTASSKVGYYTTGIVNATNGVICTSNAYPIGASCPWTALGNVGSIPWQSNNVLYRIWTNSLTGHAGTNLVDAFN